MFFKGGDVWIDFDILVRRKLGCMGRRRWELNYVEVFEI